jgi:dTDP-4-amino-4,6-dideoxygalactose transaminase
LPALRVPEVPKHIVHAAYKTYVFLEPQALKADWNRDRILHEINAAGVPAYSGSCSEVYLEKAFDGTPWRPQTSLPVAKALGETSLMFLVHPTLTDANIARANEVITSVVQQASA